MRLLKISTSKIKTGFLVVLLGAVALAQSASEWDSHAVNEIAAKLQCSMSKGSTCSCKQDIACTMPPYPCPICKMNKVRIFNMMNQGMTEQQILDVYQAESGPGVLTVHPGAAASIGPWAALGMGLLLVVMIIRRYKASGAAAPAGAPVDPAVLEQIEKDLSKLD
jgi:cytochrome c-type biogenesis protein CcmH/NrfF